MILILGAVGIMLIELLRWDRVLVILIRSKISGGIPSSSSSSSSSIGIGALMIEGPEIRIIPPGAGPPGIGPESIYEIKLGPPGPAPSMADIKSPMSPATSGPSLPPSEVILTDLNPGP